MDIILFHFLFGFVACVIGALPFGLVNLSVVDLCINKTEKAAIIFSFGASIIEVLFALLAIFLGKNVSDAIETSFWISFSIVFVLFASGLFFLFKRPGKEYKAKFEVPFLLRGIFSNLISVQVLLYWFLAIAFLENNGNIDFTALCMIGFIAGVFVGKMLTLLFYKLMSKKIKNKSTNISKKINSVIGILLLIVAVFQMVKMFTSS